MTPCRAAADAIAIANATQAVFGEGAPKAEVMLVGEQPGDREDLAGKPFVGPAGQLLDEALEEAGIDRSLTYVTNAVKHFKWQARGKRRIHQKPNWSELNRVPSVARGRARASRRASSSPRRDGGAVAARPRLPCHAARGELLDSALAEHVIATVHPSAILRQPTRSPATPSFRRSSTTSGSSRSCSALRLRDGQREGAGALHPLDLKLKRALAAELERDRCVRVVPAGRRAGPRSRDRRPGASSGARGSLEGHAEEPSSGVWTRKPRPVARELTSRAASRSSRASTGW